MNADHPYKRQYLEVPLALQKLKLECLQKRMFLMPEGKTDYEKNERTLTRIATGAEIKAQSLSVGEKEAYLINYFNKVFIPDLEALEANLEKVVNSAQKRTEPEILEVMSKLTYEAASSNPNVELMIHSFKSLKNLLK